MRRYRLSIFILLLSMLLLITASMDVQAQANPEAAKILAKIAQLEFQKAPLVFEVTEAYKTLTRLNVKLIGIEQDIAWATMKLNEAQAELAMAMQPAAIDFWHTQVQRWDRILVIENKRKEVALDDKETLENRISVLEADIAEIDKQLMKLYALLMDLI